MIRLTGLVELGPLKEYYADEPEDHTENIDNGPADQMNGDMVKAKLLQLSKEVTALFNTVSNQDILIDWAQDKITQAADAIRMVYNYVEYENNKNPTIGDGTGYPAEGSSDRGNNNR